MNGKFKIIIKNLSYSFSANLVSLLISMLLVAIVPKVLGVQEYGYWQLYSFYASYVGFFHFGWADGIYLRNGGKEYSELDKAQLHSQYWLLMIFEIMIAIGISIVAITTVGDADKSRILIMTAMSCFLLLPRTMLQFVLQCTNRIEEYAKNVLAEKIIYSVIVLAAIFIGTRSYQPLLLADIAAKVVTLASISWLCRDIVFTKAAGFRDSMVEVWTNLSVGIKLMFANVASMLIIGVVRLAIENTWDIETFGKISFTMSISNLMMVFINAISIVMFPILKRTPQDRWGDTYKKLRIILVVPVLGALLAYYPAKVILSAWLPQYAESLTYMALMFPICLYEGKMAMIINTYFKALRMEKTMLFVNVVSVLFSFLSTAIIILWMKNIPLAVLSILLLLAFRCILAEIILSKAMKISVIKDNALEVILSGIFIITSWFIGGWVSMVAYLMAYLVFLGIKRKEIAEMVKFVCAEFKGNGTK